MGGNQADENLGAELVEQVHRLVIARYKLFRLSAVGASVSSKYANADST